MAQVELMLFQLKKNTLDINVIANKFWWKYLRKDKVNSIRTLYVKSQSIASTSSTTFSWAPQTQTEWVIFEPSKTHHLVSRHITLTTQYLHLAVFFWKIFDSCKLQRFLQATKFFFMFSFTHTNSFFSGTYLLKLPSS